MTPSSIVVLTGAGISVESGIPSFRDPDGMDLEVCCPAD